MGRTIEVTTISGKKVTIDLDDMKLSIDDIDELYTFIRALDVSVRMVNYLREQNQVLMNALEAIVVAKGWIGRDYKIFASRIVEEIKHKNWKE